MKGEVRGAKLHPAQRVRCLWRRSPASIKRSMHAVAERARWLTTGGSHPFAGGSAWEPVRPPATALMNLALVALGFSAPLMMHAASSLASRDARMPADQVKGRMPGCTWTIYTRLEAAMPFPPFSTHTTQLPSSQPLRAACLLLYGHARGYAHSAAAQQAAEAEGMPWLLAAWTIVACREARHLGCLVILAAIPARTAQPLPWQFQGGGRRDGVSPLQRV